MTKRIAILGGGVSGAVFANELSKAGGYEIHLFEKQPFLGGLQRSVEYDGHHFDIGTFVLDDGHEIFKSFPELKALCLPRTYAPQSVRVSGRIDDYPLSFKGYAREVGRLRALWHILSIVPGKLKYRRKKTVVEHIQYYLGRGIYVESGLKHYMERLYQLPDAQIDIAFATQRLQYLGSFSLRRILRARLHGISRALTPARPGGLPASFNVYVRPEGGFGVIYGHIEARLRHQGVFIHKGTEIESITCESGIMKIGGQEFDRIVSTIPVPTLARYAALDIEANFECIDLVSLFYRFSGEAGFSASVLFNYSRAARWKRLTLFSHYYGKTGDGEDYFAVECISRDPSETVAWLRKDFEDHVRSLGLFQGTLSFQGSVVTANAYPVFRASEMTKIQTAKNSLEAMGIDLLGRQGAFEFLSSSQAAGGSRKFAEKVLRN